MGYLVLTRKIGQRIIIGDGKNKITLTVIGIEGNQVRISIDSSTEVTVHQDGVKESLTGKIVLTIKIAKSITIYDGEVKIIVGVVSIEGNQVRITVTAPTEITVHREEIYDRIHNDSPQ